MSFASEPGRDDGNLPPANIVIPDDARDLDRDVLAYHRELRAQRRRRRILRLFGPFSRREYGGHAAILPLIATCVALSMLAGAMLSVITIGPASAPTTSEMTDLPAASVWLNGRTEVAVRSLQRSVLALVPANCDCGPNLGHLAGQAANAGVGLYFVASGTATSQVTNLATQYGDSVAVPAYDKAGVLAAAYRPVGLTVLLVYRDATAKVLRDLPANFQLGPDLRQLASQGTGGT